MFSTGIYTFLPFFRKQSELSFLVSSPMDMIYLVLPIYILPILNIALPFLSLIKRSLLYSDLSEIFEYSTGTNRSEKELIELFEELVDDETKSPENSEGTQKKKKILKQSSLFDEEAVNHSKESVVQEMRNILQKLYWLLSTVLRLSALHDIYISPKAPEEYKKLKMQNIITFVTEFENPQDPLWDKAIHIIKNNKKSDAVRRIIWL